MKRNNANPDNLDIRPKLRDLDPALMLRTPTLADGPEMWRLARESAVLDVNSCYAYLLLCRDFADTCVVAQLEKAVVGFVTGYIPPQRPDVVYVWQVAVDRAARKKGLGKQMLAHLISRPACEKSRFLEATVSPSNRASRRLFQSVAETLHAPCEISPGFRSSDFGDAPHEEEEVFRIGPFCQGD